MLHKFIRFGGEIEWLRFGNISHGLFDVRKKKKMIFIYIKEEAQDHTANAIDPEIEDLTIVLRDSERQTYIQGRQAREGHEKCIKKDR